MTKKLYYDSVYIRDWKTRITNVYEKEDGCYVTLEETAFYPHGGGQPCDLGWINKIPVLDVFIEGEEILHKLKQRPERLEADCRLDWQRRFDHMQHHSGQHLLSAVCLEQFGAETLSFHLGDDYCTIDVRLEGCSQEDIGVLEDEANRHIYLNHAIVSYFVTAEEAAKLPLVKAPKVTENIRIVEMKDVEYNACGGTHVSSTGEIGIIKLLKVEKQKGNTRLYFKSGSRALDEFSRSQEILRILTSKYKVGKDEIIERIEKEEEEHKRLQTELTALKEQNDQYFVQQLLARQNGEFIAEIVYGKSFKDAQNIASKLAAASEFPVILGVPGENKVVVAYGGSQKLSCGAFFKANLGTFHGKGGGSDKMAQAAFTEWEDASAFYEFAISHFKG
ncbi:hydrolase [Paenibacillus sp. CAA11]|uniref:alanyl-tRNA editing protein n=1 Tax=Paenibacillus sp. CAA11 TaxID=1532905 RepID=UPI000D3D5EDA|nr:DHHA1 domain-containing protein [Paenibacillus sp. CAA11]AWB44100.1 hydrolase [Paenibacillus sp. CAA11]